MTKKFIVLFLFLFLAVFSGCNGETPTQREENIYGDDMVWDNSKIDVKDIEVTVVREKIPTFYDGIKLEITNNSQHFLCWNGVYNIYEKTGAGYILVDNNNDGVTNPENQFLELIESGSTDIKLFRIYDLITEGSAKVGEYKIEIPLGEDKFLTADFEITEEEIPFDSDIELVLTEDKFAIESEEYFSCTVINNSETDLGLSLSLIISKYENGQWIRLPVIQKYDQLNYPSAMPQQILPAGGKVEQEFKLSLANIIDAELTPGKYRIEKEIFHDWYFAEFELY